MDYRTQLLTLAECYGRSTGLSEARIATLAQNQGGFFKRIRAGKGCSVDTYLKVKGWFASHWPAALPWPDGVDQPDILPRTNLSPTGSQNPPIPKATPAEDEAQFLDPSNVRAPEGAPNTGSAS
ncbi:hypothetical protein TSA6c_17235 [Azospirillum sp. TSA6c]|nr:hypothetical protein TSA6c_17235 [Azospirillum sp. TSA6c]